MSDLSLALRQFRYETRSFWRNTAAAGFTFVFPLMFLVIFTVMFGNGTTDVFGREVAQSTFYVPAIVAFSIVTACYTNIAMGITFARDEGVLKRLRGTPLPTWAYLFGRIANACFIALLLVVISVAFGAVFYDVEVPTNTLPAFITTLLVSAASFCALGLAVTAAIPNADAAPAIVNFSVLPLLFISDVFLPPEVGPEWLKRVADFFPVRHSGQALLASFMPFETGSGFRPGHLAVISAWGLAGALIALKTFRWEPSEGRGG